MPLLKTLTASQILAIAPNEPERLFSGDPASLRHEFAVLAKCWHPDCNGTSEAAKVMERVVALHDAARRKHAVGEWSAPGVIRIDTTPGNSFVLKVKRRHEFELGEMAVAINRVAFLVEKEHTTLFETGLRRIKEIRYPDARIRGDLAKFMPNVRGVYETAKHHVAIMAKTEDVILLKDLVAHVGGQLPPKHTAWVVSSLLNLACFFEVTGITHNAISPETIFVTAKHHAVYVLGGWWYAAPTGSRIELLPEMTYALMPRSMATSKRADIRLDLEFDPRRRTDNSRRFDRPRPGWPRGLAETDDELPSTAEFRFGYRGLPGLGKSPQRQLRTASLHGAADLFPRRLSIGG